MTNEERRSTRKRRLDAEKEVKSTFKISSTYELLPKDPCHKCGRKAWRIDILPLTYSCITCGNIAYFQVGAINQQIDIVAASHIRGDDYVRVGGKVLPKLNEDLQKIKVRLQLRKSVGAA